ncbi:hypothetical protein ACFQU7_25705 [Pseudoroseomonas wenyumeiae]
MPARPAPRGGVAESIFYVVEVSLPDKDLPEFAEWYATVHAPHLFQAGFNNCTSYLAVSGGMSVVDIYQADDWSMFEAPAFERYRGLVFTEPYRPKVLAEVENTRTVYVHHARTPLPSRAPDAPWMPTGSRSGASPEMRAAKRCSPRGWRNPARRPWVRRRCGCCTGARMRRLAPPSARRWRWCWNGQTGRQRSRPC